jgi:hypothetical protein
MMLGIEHLHLVPPGPASTGYVPGFQIMTYHVFWNESVSFGVYMKSDGWSYVAA